VSVHSIEMGKVSLSKDEVESAVVAAQHGGICSSLNAGMGGGTWCRCLDFCWPHSSSCKCLSCCCWQAKTLRLFPYAAAHKRNFFHVSWTLRPQRNAGSTLAGHVPPAGTRVPEASSFLLPVTLAASCLLQSLITELSRVAEI